jgi:hypothetical protein
MARIFNIYFLFDDIMHSAVVSVRTTPFYTEFTLKNFNDELIHLLPGTKILSQSPGHFVFENASSDNSEALMNVIIKAVAEHMQPTTQA